jgi:metal-responsive CopG/Arc/MetJ family transcriptional regulator
LLLQYRMHIEYTFLTMAEKQTIAVNLHLSEKLLKEVDDFRFKNRFPSRTEAIRWLLEQCLKQGVKPTKAA